MFNFLRLRSLRKVFQDISNLLYSADYLQRQEVRDEVNSIFSFIDSNFPDGIDTLPCPATRAFCVDLVRTAIRAEANGFMAPYIACMLINVYFSAWDIYEKSHDSKARDLKIYAKDMIKFLRSNISDDSSEIALNF